MINKKLGYYTVDGKEFSSKIQACLFATKKRKEVKWHFNDEIFSKFDWSVEPEESLDQLYDIRARYLREKYDYLILSYSGGADSHNIVESFLRQNLTIDEILVNTVEKASSKFTIIDNKIKNPENTAAEHFLQTIPRLNEIKKRNSQIKITICDLSDHLMSNWLLKGDESWVEDRIEGLNPLNVTRFNYLYYDDIKRKFDKEKNIGIIIGVDKPKVHIYTNGWYVIKFDDRVTNIIPINSYLNSYDNSSVEFFYWSPDSIKILCKQAHEIKRWLKLNPQYQKYWYFNNLTHKIKRTLHEPLLRSIIYTTWNNGWYQTEKSVSDWYSEFDSFWIDNVKGTKSYDIWLAGLKYVEKHAADYLGFRDGKADGLIHFYKPYVVSKNSLDYWNLDM